MHKPTIVIILFYYDINDLIMCKIPGADGNVLNGKNQSPCDLTRDSKCKELLSQYGYGRKTI